MQVYNTLGRRKEELIPRRAGEISMYVCGATVQSDPHLGHGRYAVAFDAIRRYLEWRGYDVVYVRNITDVEDKIIAAAAEQGMSVAELAGIMAAKFDDAYTALGIKTPTIEPRATDHIPHMVTLIETLIDKGLAYPGGGDVYFAVRSLPGYGKLSGRNLDDLMIGARVAPGEHKRDPLDFALWKAAKPGEPAWDSPWGSGRPGWHIECSAMAQDYLGSSFDIHAGGTDLIFPHHENEIAQSEGATGEPFARYWLHNEMLNLGGEKMSKSTGHVIDLAEAIRRFTPMAVRLFYLRAHYRTPQEYSEELLADARSAIERLWAFRRRTDVTGQPEESVMEAFIEAMDDDFNTAAAVGVLFDAVREGNRRIDQGEDVAPWVAAFDEIVNVLGFEPPRSELSGIAERIDELLETLGIDPSATTEESVARLLSERDQARAETEWERADAVRDGLAALGIVVEDTPDGARWHRR
ncbi:MAG: cysteine--tRNA ligase [Acidimicrobiia bacterium]|nr:cysteine--tRNA ligase [Acidimicrobiia bacterium]MDH3398050.1 cysteine--tRNA ligase [Acidimicrobiia bacterium]MDH5616132.1 cysteine--tRNA ligase [Acidimicrobiia bacterium]